MTDALRPETRDRLGARLGALGAGRALPFAEAVVAQVAHPLGAAPADDAGAGERAVTDALLHAIADDDATAAAARLAADAPLLAACYQNLDLLPASDAAGDAIALLVGRALDHLASTP